MPPLMRSCIAKAQVEVMLGLVPGINPKSVSAQLLAMPLPLIPRTLVLTWKAPTQPPLGNGATLGLERASFPILCLPSCSQFCCC